MTDAKSSALHFLRHADWQKPLCPDCGPELEAIGMLTRRDAYKIGGLQVVIYEIAPDRTLEDCQAAVAGRHEANKSAIN